MISSSLGSFNFCTNYTLHALIPALRGIKYMAKEYLEKLSSQINELKIESEIDFSIEMKHFISGAALYINGTICALWFPGGLAFKLSDTEVAKLLRSGIAKPQKYFLQDHIKKGYALFEEPDITKSVQWKKYFILAAQQYR